VLLWPSSLIKRPSSPWLKPKAARTLVHQRIHCISPLSISKLLLLLR
jgi:hypothetical protein